MFTLGIPSLSLTSMASRGGAGVPAVSEWIVVNGIESLTISDAPTVLPPVATGGDGFITFTE